MVWKEHMPLAFTNPWKQGGARSLNSTSGGHCYCLQLLILLNTCLPLKGLKAPIKIYKASHHLHQERNLNESWKSLRGPTFLHICSSSSPSLTFFSGQGTLLQSSKSELGICKLLKENRFPEVFSISLWSDLPLYIHCWAGQNCSIFCIADGSWGVAQMVVTSSSAVLPSCFRGVPDRTQQKPRAIYYGSSLSQMRRCVCTDELMVMEKTMLCG